MQINKKSEFLTAFHFDIDVAKKNANMLILCAWCFKSKIWRIL